MTPRRHITGMQQIYEGKAKRIFTTENPDELLMEFKDDATAFNGKKLAQFAEKGRLNLDLSCLLFEKLAEIGVPTHHIRRVDDTRLLVKRVEIIPIEFVIRNVVAGSLAERTGLDEGTTLEKPVVEYFYKSDELNDPMFNREHVLALNLATEEELADMHRLGGKVNDFLIAYFGQAGVRLIDFKLEFGRLADGTVVLADEISPDNCRLWDSETGERLDKDRFRRDLGDLVEGYKELLSRLGIE